MAYRKGTRRQGCNDDDTSRGDRRVCLCVCFREMEREGGRSVTILIMFLWIHCNETSQDSEAVSNSRQMFARSQTSRLEQTNMLAELDEFFRVTGNECMKVRWLTNKRAAANLNDHLLDG